MVENRDSYGEGFRRARFDAAARLARPDLEERSSAAKAMGLSDSFLKKIESGDKRPSFETLQLMARTYNVREGDLLPSSVPTGAEADRIIAPIMTLPPQTRSRFITQMEAFARMLASEIATIRDADHSTESASVAYSSATKSNQTGGEVEQVFGVVADSVKKAPHARIPRPTPRETADQQLKKKGRR